MKFSMPAPAVLPGVASGVDGFDSVEVASDLTRFRELEHLVAYLSVEEAHREVHPERDKENGEKRGARV